MRPGEPLAALEGLRGYAAFLVFLVHAFGLLAVRFYGIDPDSHEVLQDGDPGRVLVVLLARSHYGVDLFFVLSGLLMADLALRRWPGTARFLARRWLRIYPAYLASALLVAVVSWSWLGKTYGAAEVAGNIALLQGFFVLGIPAVNPVSWSLSYEAAFYLAVPLLAAAWARRGTPGPWALALAFALLVGIPAALPGEKARYLAYFALFVPGIALGLMTDAGREALARRVPLPLVLAAWAAFTLAMKLGAASVIGVAGVFGSGIACGLVVLKACDTAGPLARALASPVPRWLGKYSYSFFLVHYIVVHRWGAWLAERVPPENRALHAAIFLAGSLALSLAAARLLWEIAERFYFRPARRANA
jgi:peptidoglycan/LPS O-acetylase OafA/YrhL